MNFQANLIAMALLAVMAMPSTASAFCGFYIGGADAEMYADATQVTLMRVGNHTALSMSNRYEGPADDFAMVVPVPVVLMENDVNTLDASLFAKIDSLTAPRLVEYWELDPCYEEEVYDLGSDTNNANNFNNVNNGNNLNNSVVVEAQFKVGEYDISILSSDDAASLETWLSDNDYNVPAGAAPYYEPYIQSGMYFFVAKVDVGLVKKVNGKTVLSPLRFTYESEDFQLPVRLGMINSQGKQDLLVYVLSPGQRYELANYPNATIPTNIEVVDQVRNDFATFYESLFVRTLKENPNAVVTEYSWNASSCDPCPGPTLTEEDMVTFGADALPGARDQFDWVVTRLHARYDKDDIGEDLVFKKADPILGGRESRDENGILETGAVSGNWNNFQGRYTIRHQWDGEVACEDPVYGRWGGPDGSLWPTTSANPSPNTTGGDVFLTGRPLEELVAEAVPELDVEPVDFSSGNKNGTACSSSTVGASVPLAGLLMLGLFGWARRRRN